MEKARFLENESCGAIRWKRVVPAGEYGAMLERRAWKRIPINRMALLSFHGVSGVHPCTVHDVSATGACISAPYHIFANEFELSFDGFSRNFLCRVVWRKQTLCGVSFVSRPCDTQRGFSRTAPRPESR
jgi:hypothetical protein